MTKKISIVTIVLFVLPILVGCLIFYKITNRELCNETHVLEQVSLIRSSLDKYDVTEKSIIGISTEGTSAKYYKNYTGEIVLIDVVNFSSLTRNFISYYFDNKKLIFINSAVDEWDPVKLYGITGELSSADGEYVVATSTREGYIVSNKALCKYLSNKPRQESVAVTASDPKVDFENLLEIFRIIANS